jgi:t-SNARE complex subunit (syntaxin)
LRKIRKLGKFSPWSSRTFSKHFGSLKHTDQAVVSARSARKKRWICFILTLIIIAIIAIVVVVVVKNNTSSSK